MSAEDLPPTQYLILEVLAARYRTGETLWTFPSNIGAALRALESAGLVSIMHGIEPKTLRARLTEAGQEASLSATYNVPTPTLAEALDTFPASNAAIMEWVRSHGLGLSAGVGAVLACVGADLKRLARKG